MPADDDRVRVLLLTPLHGHERLIDDDRLDIVLGANLDSVDAATLASVEVLVLRSGPRLDAATIDAMPRLRNVVRVGRGTDNLDLTALERRGVPVHRAAAASAPAVAELAATGLLVLCRRLIPGHLSTIEGRWVKNELVGDAVANLTVAVWGHGPIGDACAIAVAALGATVVRVLHPRRETASPGVTEEHAVRAADAHVLALPSTSETRHLVDFTWLARAAGRRPYLINVGRWDALDIDAVLDALHADALRGVHLDPLDASHTRLLHSDDRTSGANLLLTQHKGAQRSDVRATLDSWAVETALACADAVRTRGCGNEESPGPA